MKIGLRRSDSAQKLPAGNYIVMMVVTVTFAIQMIGDPKQQYLDGFVLRHLTFSSMFGYMWLHMSMAHIIGNLITLWIFGRRVNLKISDASYVLSYILLGIAAAPVHVYYDGRPTIGASGAIMGILGMHVVLCFRQFGIFGPWLILLWFLLNLTAGVIGSYPITYMAHAGGFLAGMILASILIVLKIAKIDDTGQSLLRIIRPSLYKVELLENPYFSQRTILNIENQPGITDRVSFKVDEVKPDKQARYGRKLVLK